MLFLLSYGRQDLNMVKMRGAEAVVSSLQREGIECVFGLPGVQIMQLYDAFHGQEDIRLITTRHEQAAAYMADGYVRTQNAPTAAALVVPGPGLQNASAGIGTAFACSSPVLTLSGQIDTAVIDKGFGHIHEIENQLDVIRPIVKWCDQVTLPKNIPAAIHTAMTEMKSGRPQPTVIEIPPDTLAAEEDITLSPPAQYHRQIPEPESITKAAKILSEAKKPLIWIGGGILRSGASKELQQLAEATNIPVVTTPEGKGAIPENHRLFGGVGYFGHGPASWYTPKADVILAIGTRFTDQMRGLTALNPPQQLIHIDADAGVIGRNYPAEVAITADAKEALLALIAVTNQHNWQEKWTPHERQVITEKSDAWLNKHAPLQGKIIEDIQRVVDDNAIIVSGLTNVGYWSHLYYKALHPYCYHTPSYYGTLGYAFPFALGAKLAAPNQQVICLSGDGGFAYCLSELATAVQHSINVIAMVFVDDVFGASNVDQQIRFSNRVIGTELHNPDFVKLAQAFGARGLKATPDTIQASLNEAISYNQPTIIEVKMPVLPSPARITPRTA